MDERCIIIDGVRHARMGFAKDPHPCQYDWPGDCFVQCGGHGLVVPKGVLESLLIGEKPEKSKSYTTAFFEAFPSDTFIRGEGDTIEEAEGKCWEKYQRGLACKGHEFERRGYKNGAGFCKYCNFFKSGVFEPSEKCVICGKATFCVYDTDGNWYCKEHKDKIPKDKKTKLQIRSDEMAETFERMKERGDKNVKE